MLLSKIEGGTTTAASASAQLSKCAKLPALSALYKTRIREVLGVAETESGETENLRPPSEAESDKNALTIARALTEHGFGQRGVTLPSTEHYAKTSHFTIAKSGGGGARSMVPDAVLTFLSVLTEVAVKKAKRNGLVYLQEEMKTAVCGLTIETKATTSTNSTVEMVLPDTCRILTGIPLERIASEPEVLAAAVSRDLMNVTAREVLKRAKLTGPGASETLASLIDLAIGIGANTFETKNFQLTTADINLLLNTILTDHVTGTTIWGNKTIAVAIGGLGLAVDRANGNADKLSATDIPRLLNELCPSAKRDLTCTREERARAGQLTALAVKALTASNDAGDVDTHARATAAIQFLFGLAEELPLAEEEKVYIDDLRSILLAAIDRDIARALVAAGHVLTLMLPEKCSGCEEDTQAIAKVTVLLGALTSYASTYVNVKDGEAPSTEELRARRTVALEAAIDAFTSRKGAHNSWIASLGLPVGFSAGGQSLRALDPGSGEYGFLTPEVMPPQLSLPLGFAVQRVPGPKRVGFHAMATALDLAQFVAYDANAELSKVTWNSFMSPGAQLGVLVGSPTNSFVIAGEVRYAPSLFKVGDGAMPGDQPGGALRFGLFLAYYVPLFDIPFRTRTHN